MPQSQQEVSEILDGILEQIKLYALTYRSNTQPLYLQKLQARFPNEQFKFDDELIRESLLEHTGSLPIIASYFHPFLDKKVDLGKTLIMLSFHDIAEIKHGDHITFTKTETRKELETETALKLIHPSFKQIYLEFESLETNEAKYAKSIDKIAPDLLDYLAGEKYTVDRLHNQVGWPKDEVLQKIRDKKRPFMLWSDFLKDIHDALFSKFSQITIPR